MRTPAAAIAWQFGRNHRWGLAAISLYLLGLTATMLLIGKEGLPFGDSEEQQFAMFVAVPLSATVYYLLALFSYGFTGDIAGRQSVYPTRMFTLPVTTTGLVGWPMLYGGLAMVIVWVVTRTFAPWPSAVTIPLVWPGLLAAVLLAWTQALMWTSYGLRGIRVFAIATWLSLLSIVVQVALFLRAAEPIMISLLAPHLPIAFIVAWAGVSAARRGDVRDWRGYFSGWRPAAMRRHSRRPFRSSAHAQAWYEWRRSGHSLPTLVAFLLPFELALLLVASDAPAIAFSTLAIAMVTPPIMALFVAANVRKSGATDSESYQLTTFIATKPMTNASLIAAKLSMAVQSTLLTWLIVFIAVPIALYLTDTEQMVIDLARRMVEALGTPRFVGVVILGIGGLVATTFKQLVQSLYVGLSGRPWMVKASTFGALALVTVGTPCVMWLSENLTVIFGWWVAISWTLAILTAVKLGAAAWISTRLHKSRMISDRTLAACAVSWFILVLGAYGLTVWILSTPLLPTYVVLLVAILVTPLTRLAAAPLALEGNRHR